MTEHYLNFLRWLSQHGIDPEVPLIVLSVLTGEALRIMFESWCDWRLDTKNLRRISIVVTAQTLWHIEQEAAVAGYGAKSLGRVIDKWSRTKRAEKAEQAERKRK